MTALSEHPPQSRSLTKDQGKKFPIVSLLPWRKNREKKELLPDIPIKWPFNEATLRNPAVLIKPSEDENQPGITIRTPSHSDLALRSPADGKLVTIEQQDSLAAVILFTSDPQVIVILRNLTSVVTREQTLTESQPADPDLLTQVHAGDIIGTCGTTDNDLLLQIAYRPRGPTKSANGWKLIDPQLVLPPLNRNS